MRGASELSGTNQHLLTDQVVELFIKLGFRQEDIISSITTQGEPTTAGSLPVLSRTSSRASSVANPSPGDFIGNDISSSEALQAEIRNLLTSGTPEGKVILFKVGADAREFKATNEENNHYVALYFKDGQINYIDPAGKAISASVEQAIKTSHPSLNTAQINSSTTTLQYTNEQGVGTDAYIMGGNDYDCGVLLPLIVDMTRRSHQDRENITLGERDSKELGQVLRAIANNQSTIQDVGQSIDNILQNGLRRKVLQTYNNTEMELMALERLKELFPTSQNQQKEINRLIGEFGNKSLTDSQKVGTGRYRTVKRNVRAKGKIEKKEMQQEIMETIPAAQDDILDIMCLGQLLFEGGNKKVGRQLQVAALSVDPEDVKYPQNLEYLQKCLTNFKPAIYKNLKEHFSQKYRIDESEVQILPKATGQQVGAKIVIPDPVNSGKLKTFYVKSHQEFSSKSDPQLGTRTSNGLGFVDLKELFMYKVLEKIGYGPKTDFLIDKDISGSRVEEGIMIVTQDSGYTKTPELKEKSYQDFKDICDQMDPDHVTPETRRDLIAIDMISRVFCLGDVMVNAGNFGRINRTETKTGELMPDKWKVLDLFVPKTESEAENRYEYTEFNRRYGQDITGSFISRNGSPSHTYDSTSPVSKILRAKETEDLWENTLEDLNHGKSERKLGLQDAITQSYTEVIQFLEENESKLMMQDRESGTPKTQTSRRMEDLKIYRDCALKNYQDLTQGIQQHKQSQPTLSGK